MKNFLIACVLFTFLATPIFCNEIVASNPPPPKKAQPQTPAAPPKFVPPPKIKIPQQEMQSIEIDFMSPGVVAVQGGQWLGNEHLLGVSPRIGVVVEVVKPPGIQLPISEDNIRDHVARILKAGGVHPMRDFYGVTPLPFFHIILMITPIEKGYAVFVAGRLFEEVQLNRVHFKPGTTFQAITWEKQELVILPKEQITSELSKWLDSIANAFVERFKAYPELKQRG